MILQGLFKTVRKKGGYLKRPMVWGVGLLFLCFLIRITFFNKQVQKEQYCLNALFDREAFVMQ